MNGLGIQPKLIRFTKENSCLGNVLCVLCHIKAVIVIPEFHTCCCHVLEQMSCFTFCNRDNFLPPTFPFSSLESKSTLNNI